MVQKRDLGAPFILLTGVFLATSGCHTVKLSEPARTAQEQLLLSTAADRALEEMDLSLLDGKKVFLEEKYFKSYDSEYVLAKVRDAIAGSGAFLANDRGKADVIVEARSGSLGLDSRATLVGIPPIALPIPFVGPLQTPEVSVFKVQKKNSIAKLALLAYNNQTGARLHSTGAHRGKAHFNNYTVLGLIAWRRTDISELRRRR